MDDVAGIPRGKGGTIEPVKQATLVDGRPKLATQDPPFREYELYDPFANVKHRAKSFDEMVVKAERAQAIRFIAVDADGSRTPVQKVDGKWQVPAPQPLLPFPDPATSVDVAGNLKRHAAAERAKSAMPVQGEPVQAPPAASRQRTDAANARMDAERQHAVDVGRIQESLHERYVIKRSLVSFGDVGSGQTEYRFRGDNTRIAFTESNSRLATDTNSPSVARSMVDVAQARSWKGLRVSGSEDFKRMVWLEANVRGLKAVGYEPVPGDLELLRKERESRLVNRVEPLPGRPEASPATAGQPSLTTKESARGSGGRKAVLEALEAVLLDKKVPSKQREAIMTAASDNLARRTAAGEVHKVRVYDAEAPSRRAVAVPTPEVQRIRDRAQPAPSR